MFSYVSLEQRVPPEHPLRPLRLMVDTALAGLGERFAELYAQTGRPASHPPPSADDQPTGPFPPPPPARPAPPERLGDAAEDGFSQKGADPRVPG